MVSASKKQTGSKLTVTYIVMGEWADDPRKKPFRIGTTKSFKEAEDMAWDFMADWQSENVPVNTWIEESYAPYQTTAGTRAKRNARK